ncbi:MAG: restriction endonuclease subunit S [Magnetococcales bacterium]|nr:restriction endonuclease subunit S [Magnetococcales bacterium]
MTPEIFFANFGHLAGTPGAVKRLRKLILQLAVQGKLVPQDPNDEPASVLLEKIAAEKARLVKEGQIRQPKPLPPIKPEEVPFELPGGWEWCRFGDYITELCTGPFGSLLHKSDYVSGGIPLINPSNIKDQLIDEDEDISVTKEMAQSKLSSYILNSGDVVLGRRGEMGHCALVTTREHGWICGTGCFFIRMSDEVARDYILLLFRTHLVRSHLQGESVGTTMTNLNHRILVSMVIGIPPLPEQRRIVERVDQLTALCDRLEEQLQQSRTDGVQLMEATVRHLRAA